VVIVVATYVITWSCCWWFVDFMG